MATKKTKITPELKKMVKKTIAASDLISKGAKKSASSIPFGEFAEITKGFEPRSREVDTREANMRDKDDFITYYSQRIARQTTDRLSVPHEHVPAGMTFMWARKTCRGQYDGPNMRCLEDKGWMKSSPAQMPQYAYMDDLGGLRDDAGEVENGGLVGMVRYKELTDHELKIYAERSRSQNNAINANMKTVAGDLHPFSQNSRVNPNDPFQFADASLIHTPTGQDFRRSFSG